jgi:putative ABC transport system permease protein
MQAINLKLLRDLYHMRGMVVVISLMIISGVATYITLLSTLDSLRATQQGYYQEYHFSNLFASLKRAPNSTVTAIREIPGINRVETRILAGANVTVPGYDKTVRGLFISLPNEGESLLNRVHLREGSIPEPFHANQVIVGDAFAEAHHLKPGDELTVTMNGRLNNLVISGIGLSPEFIYQSSPGSIIPDFESFGIFWMRRASLEAAFDMHGAFNNLVASTTWQADEADIIQRLDRILEPYGGLGATGRSNQQSHFYITEELNQLGQLATIIPVIFLGIAAFLLNIVIGRLIQTQQGQIAILKAFGYSNTEIGWHYILMVSVIVIIGFAAGILLGMYLGELMAGLYASFYRFPFLDYRLNFPVFVSAALVSFGAAFIGVMFAVRKAVLLPPAEGMRPEPPLIFRRNIVERIALLRRLDQPSKMILRQLSYHRFKTAFSIIGIAFAASLVIIGRMSNDSVNHAVEVEFRRAQPSDLSLSFDEAISDNVIFEINRIPGIHYTEPYRVIPVRMRNEHRSYLTSVQAFPDDMQLRLLMDADQNPVHLPPYGIMLTQRLGELLGLQTGDTVRVEFLDTSRRSVEIPVAGFINQYFGLSGYMRMDALNRLLPDQNMISGAYLNIDRSREEAVTSELRKSPFIAEITSNRTVIENFYESTAQTWLIMAFIVSLFAGATAFSVVYNNARISLSERSRELASLRVLGYTKGEIAYILLGELWIIVLIAIPIGLILGTGMTAWIIHSLETDLYRIPMDISSTTYTMAALTVILSAIISGWVLRSKLNRLDLISVLKTRE